MSASTPAIAVLRREGVRHRLLEYETIVLNAGRRGLQLELAPADVIRLTSARTLPLVATGS